MSRILQLFNSHSLKVAFLVVGTNVGLGVLGVAYSIKNAGWPIWVLWVLLSLVMSSVSMLYLLEVCARTKDKLHLAGLADKYLGKVGCMIIFTAVTVHSYSCLWGYTSACGDILSSMLGVSLTMGKALFMIPAVGVIYLGLRAVAISEKFVVTAMIIFFTIIAIVSFSSDKANVGQVMFINLKYSFPSFGLAIFALVSPFIVPEIYNLDRSKLKQSEVGIPAGMSLAALITMILPLSVLAVTGTQGVTPMATIAWGQALGQNIFVLANLFALTAMITCYWTIGLAFLMNIVDIGPDRQNLGFKKHLFYILIVCGVSYLLSSLSKANFVDILTFSGTFAGVTMYILPVFLLRKAREASEQEPTFVCGWYSHKYMQNSIIVLCGLLVIYYLCRVSGFLFYV